MSSLAPNPKRLIEVDLPIRRISEHARREKSVRHGHISTLHIWWARRPLAACRAVLCAALWPAPTDPQCPDLFLSRARDLMRQWARTNLVQTSRDSYRRFLSIQKHPSLLDDPRELQNALLDFIADFADWDNSSKEPYMETCAALTQTAHKALGGEEDLRPLVADPFSGGGAIPLEAVRVGADVFASDLNSVAILLNKVILEYVAKFGPRLAHELRAWGEWVRVKAQAELAPFYPDDPDGAVPIGYLWARTIACEGPGCGAEIPLTRSLWLSKKPKRSVALSLVVDDRNKRVDFQLLHSPKASEVAEGTIRRSSATCPVCGYTTPAASVRRQLKEQQGGAEHARLFAVVTTRPSQQGRFYRLPTQADLAVARSAKGELDKRIAESSNDALTLVPNEPLPIMSGVFNAPIYGHNTWGSLFTPRQALTLTTFVRIVRQAGAELAMRHTDGLAEAVQTCLALAVSRLADRLSCLCSWRPQADQEKIEHVFTWQALPMTWDFAEGNPFSLGTAGWNDAYEPPARLIEALSHLRFQDNTAVIATATAHPLPDDAVHCYFTDPPYYNAVPYADLSDYFYVWLRRILRDQHADLFGQQLSPKEEEICEMAGWDPIRYPQKDGRWFESRMGEAMAEGRRILAPNGIGVVVFAHKSTSGWEAQLQALIDAGWVVTGSWPIDTEMSTRLRARNSAVLASSIHLVCRPREYADGSVRMHDIGDWRDVLQELPARVHEWMPRLAQVGIVGADAIFACLGPALEIYSRYMRVEKASGELVTLGEYLEQVWAAVAREALSVIFDDADTAGFEPDARLTAMWLWTLTAGTQSTNQVANGDADDEGELDSSPKAPAGYSLEFDAARKIAQGLGAHLEKLGSLVQVKGGTAHLLPVAERASYLFGAGGGTPAVPQSGRKVTHQLSGVNRPAQLPVFAALEAAEEQGGPSAGAVPRLGSTMLDQIHQAMILFASGRGEALRRFIVDGGVGRDGRFWRLAQALSALYPAGSDEKRWVDGVLARKKGLGF